MYMYRNVHCMHQMCWRPQRTCTCTCSVVCWRPNNNKNCTCTLYMYFVFWRLSKIIFLAWSTSQAELTDNQINIWKSQHPGQRGGGAANCWERPFWEALAMERAAGAPICWLCWILGTFCGCGRSWGVCIQTGARCLLRIHVYQNCTN